jgi:hypothetical protein
MHVIDRPIDVDAKGAFPEVETTSHEGQMGSDSESEAEAMNTELARKSSLPLQVKETVIEVAKDVVNDVTKTSNSEDENLDSWKDRSVFTVRLSNYFSSRK